MAIALRPRSLEAKLVWGTVLVVCLLMISVLIVVEQRQRTAVLEEAERRGQVLARDLAAISRGPLLLYNFTVLEQNVARLATEDDALRERAIPEGLLPSLVVEGRSVVLDSKWPKLDDFKPQILVFGNGDLSSFEVTLERESSRDRAQISSDEQSVIRMRLPGEEKAVATAVRNAPPPTP